MMIKHRSSRRKIAPTMPTPAPRAASRSPRTSSDAGAAGQGGVPSTAGYPRKRARTRRRLMTAGMSELAEHGPDGLTVGGVARLAGVAPGTFYNHFADLDALVAAIVAELAAGVEISGEELRSIEHDPAARVAIGTRQLMSLAHDEPATARAFVTLLATVPEFRSRVRSTVRKAIEDGIEQGRFAPQPPLVTTDAILGAVVQWMRTQLAGESDRQVSAGYLDLALRIVGLPDEQIPGVIASVAG